MTYQDYDARYPRHRRPCIDGRITGCGNCVGYCTFAEHRGFLTDKLRRSHRCMEKGCHYFLSKPPAEPRRRPAPDTAQLRVQDLAVRETQAMEGLKFMEVSKVPDGWVIAYIAIAAYNVAPAAQAIGNIVGCQIQFVQLPYPFDIAAALILSKG